MARQRKHNSLKAVNNLSCNYSIDFNNIEKMNTDKTINIKCEAKDYYQLDDLIPFQGNLKSIDKSKFDKLKSSLIKDGLPLGFHVWKDSKGKVFIIDGHHRQLALKALQDEGYHIPALPCTLVMAKNKKEAAKAVLISNSKYAEMSQESLSDFMIDMELDFGELEFLDLNLNLDLKLNDFNKDNLSEEDKEILEDIQNKYSDKISSPVYNPKLDEAPPVSELFSIEKYNELVKEINERDLPKEIKSFLICAASRHIVFNYENIAEFYCHQNKTIQELMEKSALIIIDFKKAVENGFVRLSEELNDIYENQKQETGSDDE